VRLQGHISRISRLGSPHELSLDKVRSKMQDLNVLVVGAGIGGLQTALALATNGHKITVFESVKEFLEV
jgi:ribulose 1,5-bisphosphate synthetase/thiazole synthase